MSEQMRVRADIDLSAIESNLRYLHSRLRADTQMIAVVKANAYGHGAKEVSRHLADLPFLYGFAVACVEEAVELRDAGIKKPILLLSYAFPESYEAIADHDLTACIFDLQAAEELSACAIAKNRTISIHLAVDTGMGRIGFSDTGDSVRDIESIMRLPGLSVEGIFTHFSRADEKDLAHAQWQYDRFLSFICRLEDKKINIPLMHTANSAAIMQFPESQCHLARAGIAMYGVAPSDDLVEAAKPLQAAMRLVSHITFVKDIAPGDAVSYGGTFVAKERMRIATVPVGYADGYPRSLSNCGHVLIHGKKAPILGRICMDQMMIDVSAVEGASRGDEVVLLGTSGGETITVEELGALSGRFPYEFICDITQRVPRRFIKGPA